MKKVTKTDVLNISKLSDDDLQDMFTESYGKIAFENRYDSFEFECRCKRDNNTSSVIMEVIMTGMAGSPTIDDFKADRVKGAKSVTISREDKGSMTFKLSPSETTILNVNDYIVTYRSV